MSVGTIETRLGQTNATYEIGILAVQLVDTLKRA